MPGGAKNANYNPAQPRGEHGKWIKVGSVEWFVDGVLNNNLKPLTNSIKVGEIQKNVIDYLKQEGIELQKSEIELSYGKVNHINRDSKKESQKVTPEQLKRVDKIVSENNVFYDTAKKNIIYISKLPPDEVKISGRDWIKTPVNLNDKDGNNIVVTMSIIKLEDIINHKQYKKID